MTRKQYLILILGLVVLGCIILVWLFLNPRTLNDLAFDANRWLGYTVYLPEEDGYAPYLVLTRDYNGHCLLLRKHLLDEQIAFNFPYPPVESYEDYFPAAYYENSIIDQYLSNSFLATLPALRDLIIDTEVIITHKNSIGRTGQETTIIERKVFLLSHTEVTGLKSLVPAPEGEGLACFTQWDRYALPFRIATTAAGEAYAWWLRTPDNWAANLVNGISADGYIGGGVAGFDLPGRICTNGVRPALCLPGDTLLTEGELDGKKVYMIMPPGTASGE